MTQAAISSHAISEKVKIGPFHIISLIFILIFILSNIAATKISNIFSTNIVSGIVYFPLVYVISDIVTEVYGFRASRKIIWTAAIMNLLCAILLYFAVLMPNAPGVESNGYFNSIFGLSSKILIASILSFVLGEYVNSIILSKTKLKLSGRFFAFRAIISTFCGCVIETFTFVSIVFYHAKMEGSIFHFSLMLIGIKVLYEVALIPFTSVLVRFLKDYENLDYYDHKTKFSLFSLK